MIDTSDQFLLISFLDVAVEVVDVNIQFYN